VSVYTHPEITYPRSVTSHPQGGGSGSGVGTTMRVCNTCNAVLQYYGANPLCIVARLHVYYHLCGVPHATYPGTWRAPQVGIHGEGLGRDPGPTTWIHAPEVGSMARTSGIMVGTTRLGTLFDPFLGVGNGVGRDCAHVCNHVSTSVDVRGNMPLVPGLSLAGSSCCRPSSTC